MQTYYQLSLMSLDMIEELKDYDKKIKETERETRSAEKHRMMLKVLEEHDAETQVLDDEEVIAIKKIRKGGWKSLEPLMEMIKIKLENL